MTHDKEIGYITIGVDIQNDFCPGGSLAVPNGDQVVAPFNAIAAKTRAQGGKVIFTRDWHPAQTTHFDNWPVHCVQDTPGAAFHPDLDVHPEDIIISKGMGATENAYSGFDGIDQHGVNLENIIKGELARYEIVRLKIGGLATDYCVEATVLDALKLQRHIDIYRRRLVVFAIENAMKAVNLGADDGYKAIKIMRTAGAFVGGEY